MDIRRTLLLLMGGGGILPINLDFSAFGDGALPSPLTGATWTISGGSALNTPNPGTEIHDDGNAASDPAGNEADATTGWVEQSVTIASQGADKHTGSYALQGTVVGAGGGKRMEYSWASTTGMWYAVDGWMKRGTGTLTWTVWSNLRLSASVSAQAAWTEHKVTSRATGNPALMRVYISGDTNTGYLDNLSIKPLTTSELLAYVKARDANVICKAGWTITGNTEAGVFVRVDDPSNPQNGLIATHDGTNAALIKIVGGTTTSLIDTAAAYAAGADVEIRCSGNTVQLFYNGAQVGVDQTVSDVPYNGYHGMFSTDSRNTAASFELTAN